MKLILILPFLVMLAGARSNQWVFEDRSPAGMAVCMGRHCSRFLLSCGKDAACRKSIACMKSCQTSDSICQSKCFFLYSNPIFNELTKCAVDNKCAPQLTWSNHTCPKTLGTRIQEFSVETFADIKSMKVVRGAHPVYDCFACQTLNFELIGENTVKTRWETILDGQVRGADYILRQLDPNTIHTKYELFGMPVEETYYMIDHVRVDNHDFILYFYCGAGFGGEYQGAVIYSTADTMPEQLDAHFDERLKEAQVTKYLPAYEYFCRLDNQACSPTLSAF